MFRPAGILSSEKKTAWLVRLATFVVLYSAALLLEAWFRDPTTGVNFALFSVGFLVGAMHVSHARHWPLLLITAGLLQVLTLFVASGIELTIAEVLLYSIGTTALAAFCGSTPSWLLKGDRREMRPNEIFAGCLVTTVIAGIAFVVVHRPFVTTSAGSVLDVAVALSFLSGIAAVAPVVVVYGLAYGKPRHYSWLRIAAILITAPILVVGGGLVSRQHPQWLYSLLAPYEVLWLWVTIFAGIILALRASAATSTTALLLMTAYAAYAFHKSFTPVLNDLAASLAQLVETQSTCIAIIVVILSFTALVAGWRKERELQAIRETIATDILKTEQNVSTVDAVGVRDGLTRALGVVGEYCGADECRLYLASRERDRFSLSYRWQCEADIGASIAPPDTFASDEAAVLIDQIQRGKRLTLRIDDDEQRPIARESLAAFGLSPGVSILCQPLITNHNPSAIAVMINYSRAPISGRDAKPLLHSIGEFYAGFRSRELTQKSLQEYEERLRHLATRFAHAEESVRRRTAVELHDGLIQRLAVARMKLGELRHRRNSTVDVVSGITQIVDEALGESRAIIHSLSPSVLYELGLVPGLQSLCEEMSIEDAFDIEIREHGQRCELNEPLRVCIYQVIRELVTNSIRHSGGRKIWVDLFWEQASLDAAVISDDGKQASWWLDAERQSSAAALGLLSASERLRPFGFNIKFEQRRGGGTRAIVYWAATESTKW